MSGDTEVTVVSVGAVDKYHAADLTDEELEAIDKKLGKRRLYKVGNEEMISADAIDLVEMDRFKRLGVSIDVEPPSDPVIVKIDPEDTSTWFWSCKARARNVHTRPEQSGCDGPEGWNVGMADAMYCHPEKDGKYTRRDKDGNIVYSKKVNPHAYRSVARKAIRNAKMRCLGDLEIELGLAKVKKVLEDPEVQEKIRRAREQMGVPPGGPRAQPSQSSPPPEPSAPATQAPGRDSSTPAGGDGAQDEPIPITYWGVAKDGRNEVPTLAQMKYLTAEGRGPNRMTQQEVKAINRFKASELTEKFHAEEKGA